MRKTIALLTALSYFTLSQYCLAYAAITGHPHQASHNICCDHDMDHHDADHEHAHCPFQHDSEKSGPCCSTLSCDTPSLLPSHLVDLKPDLSIRLPMIVITSIKELARSQRFTDHNLGPPGASQTICLAAPSLRAPPLSVSL
jgi:hypothetical protein